MSEANAAFSKAVASTKSLMVTPLRVIAHRIDRGDDPRLEANALRRLRQRFSGCALILDRVVQAVDFLLRPLQSDLALELGGDLGIRLDGRCNDLADAHKDRAELRLHRRADFAFLE